MVLAAHSHALWSLPRLLTHYGPCLTPLCSGVSRLAAERALAATNGDLDAAVFQLIEASDADDAEPTSPTSHALTRLVVPGRVILLKGREGEVRAVHGESSTLPMLNEIVVSSQAVADHTMERYTAALRCVWRRDHAAPREGERVQPPKAWDANLRRWKPCAVCESDVTWTCAVPDSDSSRVDATHHCRKCGNIVCAFCAPAGDRMAGDRLGEYTHLPDRRVPLPELGLLEPARVCYPCLSRATQL